MASDGSPDPLVEEPRTAADRKKFEISLRDFARQRGIPVDFGIRVAGKHIELFALYEVVTRRGGYDAVSAEKLAWRKIGGDFQLGVTNAASYAFALKSAYYKNLAAYEIKFFHGRDPPPVEILESVTAKGGNILNRTLENFKPHLGRTSFPGSFSDTDDEGAKTPQEERMEIDDPANSGGRSTRGLRQQPSQRVFFQPDLSSSRSGRHSSGQGHSPQPSTPAMGHSNHNHASSTQSNMPFSVASYEPQVPMPMNLRPIMTAGNNYPAFKAHVERAKEAKRIALGVAPPSQQGIMKPGQGYEGPNIYVRILQGLQCPMEDEQDYALHHLVKISHERGDKYKFEAFPGLAEGLVDYMLKVGALFYDVDWKVSYTEDEHEIGVLDGINGTSDILERIKSLTRIDAIDGVESPKQARDVLKVSEATLTVRNLAFLEENAVYLSKMPQLRDWLTIALNLPNVEQVVEIKHYALEIAEQVVRHWNLDSADPLYQSLQEVVEDEFDRGAIICGLRALTRISLNLENPNQLENMTVAFLRRLFAWTILEDEELVGVCLDFLYQYTANTVNIEFLLAHSDDLSLPAVMGQFVRLLQHRTTTNQLKVPVTKAVPAIPALKPIVNVPAELMMDFLRHEEPERSNRWLRTVFEEDPESFITQIDLWQAYQARFSEHVINGVGLLPAAEFIKNVSTIFAGANAQVINEPATKFIIKGIRPRHAPVDSKGVSYSRCLWKSPESDPCGKFHLKAKDMFEHVLLAHIGMKRKLDTTLDVMSAGYRPLTSDCYWVNCRHFSRQNKANPTSFELGLHVKTHLSDASSKAPLRQRHNRTLANRTLTKTSELDDLTSGISNHDPEHGREATYKHMTFQTTPVDESGKPTGLSYSSWLVLRNLARNIPKAVALSQSGDEDATRKQWMGKLMAPLKDRLTHVLTHNRTLPLNMYEVLVLLETGMK